MPTVQIDWLESKERTPEIKEKLMKGIAKAFEDIGVKKDTVTVIIRDLPRTDMGIGGVPYSRILK